jgi:hypothetical protein
MKNRIGVNVYLWLVIILAIALALGCTPKQEEETPEPAGQVEQPAQPSEENPSEESPEPSPQSETPSGEARERASGVFGSQEELTAEEVDAITGYGVFKYPDSELIPDESLHQVHPDGTEIYRLEFGVNAPIDTVSEWYRDRIEPTAVETFIERANGMHVTGFQYESSEGGWNKIITITGMPGENTCRYTVALFSRRESAAPEDESAEDQNS